MTTKKLMGMAVATAVVGLVAVGSGMAKTMAEGEGEKTVKCAGINECKGHGACAAADGSHDCAGKNSCKGKGWIKVESEDECTEKGGTVVKAEEEDE